MAARAMAWRHERSHAAESALPAMNVSQVMRITPPRRAVWLSGAKAWLIPSDAKGTPPKGKKKRMDSATVSAAGRARRRHRPPGAIAAARPR